MSALPKGVKIKKVTAKQIYLNPVLQKRLEFLTNGGWGREDSSMYFWAKFPQPAQHFWVLYLKGTVIAWAATDPDYNQVDGLRVDVECLGVYTQRAFRRQGYGTMLLNRVMAYCARHKLQVQVTPWSPVGVKFYQQVKNRVICDTRCL